MASETKPSKPRRKERPQVAPADAQPPDQPAGSTPTPAPEPGAPAAQLAEAVSPVDELCPVIGIGASAGGLAAIERFLSAMPAEAEDTTALVLVQHLDPDRKSLLADLVRQHTRMQVAEVTDGMEVQPGRAYTIPPNKDMALLNGRLRLLPPSMPRGLRLPIDFFFRSLAQDRREKAIGVVLSGAGTDGTLGIKAIKEGGGLVMVQAPESAQYDGMPRSAIGTGLADAILPPDEMPAQLFGYIQRALSGLPPEMRRHGERDLRHAEPFLKIFALLRAQAGHDFSRYKQNTIVRRIERQMALHQIETIEGYVRYLQQKPTEVGVLFRELLIGVTNFFRDPEAFAIVEQRVVPAMFGNKRSGDVIRLWVPGCSTGEEAFSLAMLVQEYASKAKADVRAQIFATDIDIEAIDQARLGVYPNSIAADVSAERLTRFFTEEGTNYRVKKAIRDMVIFAEQNVAEDPPFSRIDLVSCRNLLIYMNTDLQRRVLPLFHYALNPLGYLFLGTSESIGEFSDFFAPVDRKYKIFLKKPGGLPHRAALDFSRTNITPEPPVRRPQPQPRQEARMDVRQVMERTLLAQHTPAAVAVNAEGDVLYVHGRTGYYLEPAEGEASLNVLRMAREGLRLELATVLRKAVASQDRVVEKELTVRTNGDYQTINLVVRPMPEAPVPGHYLIVFEPITAGASGERGPVPAGSPSEKDQRILMLERELRSKEEYLQTTIEELETSNEELTSTNEELQSANEELQSTNEELETSKEELQSVNEELMTVNMELQKKIEELSRVNNDLNNLLTSTGIGTVFVDHALRIQRFTPAATDIINLIQTDVGRPVAHIVSNLVGYGDLIKDVTSVLDTLVTREREVQVRNGRWYLMRIQPYRTLENVIEGAVITFVDISSQVKIQAALDESRRLRIESMFDPAFIVNASGRVLEYNRDALALLGYAAGESPVLRLADLVAPAPYIRLLEAVDDAGRGQRPAVNLQVRKKDGSSLTALARVRQVDSADGRAILVVLHDVQATPGEQPGQAPRGDET